VKISLLLFILVLAFGCEDLGTDQPPTERWAIYRLRDDNITAYDASRQPLGTLVLADEPFMTVADISAYHWLSHTFVPSPRIENQLTTLRDSHGSLPGIPFVVKVGSDRVYMGAFWYAYSSLAPTFPHIDLISNPHQIQPSWEPGDPDLRNDIKIYNALRGAGVLIE
jgi:hypothetical protein